MADVDINEAFDTLAPEHQALLVSMTQKLLEALQGNGVAVVIVHVDVGRAEMLHIGGHNEVASLLKAGFQQYMFENNPRESGVVLQ